MNLNEACLRSRELRKRAKDCYAELSQQQATQRRQMVIAKYICIHIRLVRREEFKAARLMHDVIEDVRRPMQLPVISNQTSASCQAH